MLVILPRMDQKVTIILREQVSDGTVARVEADNRRAPTLEPESVHHSTMAINKRGILPDRPAILKSPHTEVWGAQNEYSTLNWKTTIWIFSQ